MIKTQIQYILMFAILVLAQAVVFNHICLFGIAVPLVFIYLIIKLPVTLNTNWALTIGFFLGLIVDIFSNTQGLNALSCLILAAMRHGVLHLYFPREDDMTDSIPSSKSIGREVYLKYLFSMSLLYCLVFFMIESMTFFNLGRLIMKIIGSSVLTFLFLMIIDSLTTRRREKRL